MNTKEIIKSQYLAALEMLRSAVIQCPDGLWDDPAYKNRFWHVVYHALFYTHLYLQPSLEAFVAWSKNRSGSNELEQAVEPYSKDEILEYFDICRKQVEEQVPSLDLEAPSGFHWIHLNKLELQFYTIRHLQQHTGELCERLGAAGDIEVDWVGKV
jgi:hypothetical protein